MSIQSGIACTQEFTTRSFATGAKANADSLPTGTVVVNGIDSAAAVTVTNAGTGKYTAAFTLPALATGDAVNLRIDATVAGVTDADIVWRDTIDNTIAGIPAAVWAYVNRTLTSFGPVTPGDAPSDLPFANPHVGDTVAIVVVIVDQDLTVVNVSTATTMVIYLKLPGSNGAVMTKAAVLDTTGADGAIRYNTLTTDLSVAGLYKAQGYVVLASGEVYHALDTEFLVQGNLA